MGQFTAAAISDLYEQICVDICYICCVNNKKSFCMLSYLLLKYLFDHNILVSPVLIRHVYHMKDEVICNNSVSFMLIS